MLGSNTSPDVDTSPIQFLTSIAISLAQPKRKRAGLIHVQPSFQIITFGSDIALEFNGQISWNLLAIFAFSIAEIPYCFSNTIYVIRRVEYCTWFSFLRGPKRKYPCCIYHLAYLLCSNLPVYTGNTYFRNMTIYSHKLCYINTTKCQKIQAQPVAWVDVSVYEQLLTLVNRRTMMEVVDNLRSCTCGRSLNW